MTKLFNNIVKKGKKIVIWKKLFLDFPCNLEWTKWLIKNAI